MRWFKHMANSSSDEKLCSISDSLGLEGYGFYWKVLEIIAQQMDKSSKTFCQYSAKTWGKFAGISAKKFENFIQIFEKHQLFMVKFERDSIFVDCPNLLKYKDEYSCKPLTGKEKCRDKLPIDSGQTPAHSIYTEAEAEAEAEAETETEKISTLAPTPENGSEPTPPEPTETFIHIPTNRAKIEYPVTESQVREFESLYLAVDVREQLRKIRGWSVSNHGKRKTYSGMLRFVNSWLSKEQDKGGRPNRDPPQTMWTKQGEQNVKVLEAYINRRGPTCKTD